MSRARRQPAHELRTTPRALAGLALVATLACGGADERDAVRPNVLLYVADTLRADGLGCYGNEVVDTPHLDAFAREGKVFTRAWSPSSWTRASMASMFTGTAPAVHGAEGRYDLLADEAETMAELFRAAGYRVGSITTNRNVGSFFGFDQGFAEGDFIELYAPSTEDRVSVSELTTLADEVTRTALEWIDGAGRPFCLTVHTIDPHSPYMPPEEWDRYGDGIPSDVDGSQKSLFALQTRRSQADEARVVSLYYGEIAFNDHAFGTLVEGLRERGLLEDTAVVFTSDHGEEFWEHGDRGHGKSLNEKSLHVPLIVRYPKRLAAGGRVDRTVSTVDLLPTLLDLAGLDAPAALAGRSLLLPAGREDEVVFASCRLSGLDLQSVRDGRWQLVLDKRTGTKTLHDLEAAPDGGPNVLARHRDEARRLSERLAAELDARTRERRERYGDAPPLRVDELPEDIDAELEALGYLGDGDDAPR